jgi:hypothetical protein
MLKKSLLIACSALLFAQVSFADVSGDWNFAVEIPGAGSGNAGVMMQQAADGSITGKYSGQLGNSEFTGKAEGNAFEFALTTDMGSIVYVGQLQSDGTLKGTLSLGDLGQGNFTATKK